MEILGLVMLFVVVLLLAEVPVAFAFGVGAFLFSLGTGRDISYLVPHAFWQTGGFALLALPLFIMAGALMGASGISERLVAFINAFVGRIKGGLGAVTVVACAMFGAISGSGASAIAAIGSIMIPKMLAEGYPRGHATALVGVSSVIALLIPPSVPMIVFALTAGLSVAACFLSTVIPGIIIAVIYCVVNVVMVRKMPNVKVEPKVSFPEATRLVTTATGRAFFALLMPAIMLGGIYSGVFTPTEAAAVALVYTLPVGFLIYKGLTLSSMSQAILRGACDTASIIIVLFVLFTMSRAMVLEQVPSHLADMLLSISDNKYAILFMINILLLLIGMLVDDVSGSILAAVILMPIVQKIGVDPIHFAAIVGVNLGLGNVSPPCAPLLYMAGTVSKTPLHEYVGPTMKFLLLGHLPIVFVVTFIPEIALFLPTMVFGG